MTPSGSRAASTGRGRVDAESALSGVELGEVRKHEPREMHGRSGAVTENVGEGDDGGTGHGNGNQDSGDSTWRERRRVASLHVIRDR